MKKCPLWLSLIAVSSLALGVAPVQASSFSLFGSYLDLDEPDGVAGLGVRLEVGLGASWTLDFAVSYHQEADVLIATDLVGIDVIEETTFIPFDVGARYHFGDSDGVSPYLGGGVSFLEIDTKIGEGDQLTGFYGIFGVAVGDDIGPKFFVEATYRVYEDVEIDLFDELDSSNRADFSVDGFSVAAGIRWSFGR